MSSIVQFCNCTLLYRFFVKKKKYVIGQSRIVPTLLLNFDWSFLINIGLNRHCLPGKCEKLNFEALRKLYIKKNFFCPKSTSNIQVLRVSSWRKHWKSSQLSDRSVLQRQLPATSRVESNSLIQNVNANLGMTKSTVTLGLIRIKVLINRTAINPIYVAWSAGVNRPSVKMVGDSQLAN